MKSKIKNFFSLGYTKKTPGILLLLSFLVFFGSFFLLFISVPADAVRWDELETYQFFGSYIGGTLGVLVASLAVWILHDSFVMQKDEFRKMLDISKQTAKLNEQSLRSQEKLGEQESEYQRKTFLLSQIDSQLNRMGAELKGLRASDFEKEPSQFPTITAEKLFSKTGIEGSAVELDRVQRSKVESYLTRLAFFGHDTVEFLNLGGKYHHRFQQFDQLMSMLEPFRKNDSAIIAQLAPLEIDPHEFWILKHTHEKISELQVQQENGIKTMLIHKARS